MGEFKADTFADFNADTFADPAVQTATETDDDGSLIVMARFDAGARAVVPPDSLAVDQRDLVLKVVTDAVKRSMIAALTAEMKRDAKATRYAAFIIRAALDGQDSFCDRINFDKYLDRGTE
jgi:hypothetical protein